MSIAILLRLLLLPLLLPPAPCRCILIRGECFRSGGHKSRQQSGDVQEQLDAIESLFRYVVQPATQVAEWRVVVAADVFMRSWNREEKVQ